MDRSLVSTSKFLSLVLRHRPDSIGLALDEQGWVDIGELINASAKHGRKLDLDLILRVVHENDKQRFALCPEARRIRANQGHSVPVELQLEPTKPPDILYHGTVAPFLDSIRASGLIRGVRQHVHLAADIGTATIVGKRRGEPVILEIAAGRMHANGLPFYLSQNGVWLTDHVPPEYLRFPAA